jgi:hypothetical protein
MFRNLKSNLTVTRPWDFGKWKFGAVWASQSYGVWGWPQQLESWTAGELDSWTVGVFGGVLVMLKRID